VLAIAIGLAGLGALVLEVRQDIASEACQRTGDGFECGGGPATR
jgi:hypothetical protein